MSHRMRSSGSHGKAPTIVLSQANSSSSDDDTVLASLQVTRTLQRRFDRGGDDLEPFGGIHIAHRTRSRCSMKMASVSSQSCTSLGSGSSQFPRTEEGGDLEGEEL